MSAADDGRLIGGRYRLLERIGSGGMGTVWRARDELVGRDCAVKEPRLPGDPHDPAHQRLCRRLRREARAAAQVEHPSAVAVHDVVEDGGLPWIVMELVRGESLHARLKRGPLTPAESARIGLAVAGALAAAHTKGVVHRDVKPANVLLGPRGRVVLTDFGIARIQGEEPLTVSGEFVGSLESIAPERMQGVPAGPASDLWSLGVLLYAAVEGWSPFRRTMLESTLAAILQAEPPEPQRAGPLRELIGRLLSKEPEGRPSVEEVERELDAVATGPAEGVAPTQPLPGTGGGPPDPGPPAEVSSRPGRLVPDVRASRPRLVLAATAVVASAVVGAGVWALLPGPSDNGARGPAGAVRTSQAPMATPDAWQWRPYFESRLDAEISVPRPYRREAVTSEAALDKDREITFAERGNPIQVRLIRGDRPADSADSADSSDGSDGPVAWAQRDLAWLKAGGERGGQFTAAEATGKVVPANHHGMDAAMLDVTYDALDGDTARPVHRLAFYVVTEAHERYSVVVDMPDGGREEAEGQDLFRGVRERLKLGKAETSP